MSGAGNDGHLPRTQAPAHILTTGQVIARRHPSGESAPGKHGGASSCDEVTGFAELTRREREVLAALIEGASARDIATALTVSMATVRTHIAAVLRKLDVHSQLAAVALCRRAGWDLVSVRSKNHQFDG